MSIEMKILSVVLYLIGNAVIYNYAFYCANQKSNVWLALGIAIGLITTLLNIRFIRALVAKLQATEGEKKE